MREHTFQVVKDGRPYIPFNFIIIIQLLFFDLREAPAATEREGGREGRARVSVYRMKLVVAASADGSTQELPERMESWYFVVVHVRLEEMSTQSIP